MISFNPLAPFRCSGQVMVIAELSGNHNGSKDRALELVRAAKESGADAIKLQTYTADTMTIAADTSWFRIGDGPWAGRQLYELYQEASTPWEWHEDLFAEASRLGIPCFSTPFDVTAVRFLEELGCPFYKVASFEICDVPLLHQIARCGKPVIVSTGMASLAEIDTAVRQLRSENCGPIALLSCVSSYPAKPGSMKLRNIPHLAEAFGCQTGLSDHSPGHAAACAAVALGASIIEKHITLRRDDGGPDAAFSMEPAEFHAMVIAVREIAQAMSASVGYGVADSERNSVVFRRSLFSVVDISVGEALTESNIRIIRPGHGLPPSQLPLILGRRSACAIPRGTPLSWDLIR